MPADLLAQLLAGLDTFKQRAGRFAANPMQGLAERSGPVFGVEPPPQKSARERIQEMLNVENISDTPYGQAALGMLGTIKPTNIADARRRAMTLKALGRDDKQEMDLMLNDAQRYIDQGRLSDAQVIGVLNKDGPDGLMKLLSSIEAPRAGQQRMRSVAEMVEENNLRFAQKQALEKRALQDRERRIQTGVEELPGEDKYMVLRDIARRLGGQ